MLVSSLGFVILLIPTLIFAQGGILYPQESESRDVQSLDGIWNFRISSMGDPGQGFDEEWYSHELRKTGNVAPMPVPSSYNHITVDRIVRDFVGVVWYDRIFYVPSPWLGQRVWLRFDSAHYSAYVYVNGVHVVSHDIGHLPFLVEVTDVVNYGSSNLLTVAVNNTLTRVTIPQGSATNVSTGSGWKLKHSYIFNFYHYVGIDRSVRLYTTPQVYINDVSVLTSIQNTTGLVNYSVSVAGLEESGDNLTLTVSLYDKEGELVASSFRQEGLLEVPDANLWWPYLMDPNPGYLYTLEVTVSGQVKDVYRVKIGIRTISWTNTTLLINDKPFYFRGFGKHEDSDFRGRGYDESVLVKDYNVIKWIGGNGYRTSNYPPSEEFLDYADQLGIVVIDECPIANARFLTNGLLRNHKTSLSELIKRDKNHPSVIMWSLASGATTDLNNTASYFEQLVGHVKTLDSSRPITAAISVDVKSDKAAQFLDIIGINLYTGWDSKLAMFDIIRDDVVSYVRAFHKVHNKPFLFMEYGADAYTGLHVMPDVVWSEEYQVSLMAEHFKAFDILREDGYLTGELLCYLIDFQEKQDYNYVDNIKMGVLTRQRQPKEAAYLLRQRYYSLAQQLDNTSLPEDILPYISSSFSASFMKIEL